MTKLATYSSALAATFDDECAAQPNATLLSYPLSLFQNDLPNLFEMFYEGMFEVLFLQFLLPCAMFTTLSKLEGFYCLISCTLVYIYLFRFSLFLSQYTLCCFF